MARYMYEDLQNVRESHMLHRMCCDCGFDVRSWRRRLKTIDIRNTLDSYGCCNGYRAPVYAQYSGSAAEGVAAAILGSDTDIMLVIAGTTVIEDELKIDPKDGDHIFKALTSDHVAYVNLRLKHIGDSGRTRILPTPQYCLYDGDGGLLLNGTAIKRKFAITQSLMISNSEVHGPAQSWTSAVNPLFAFDIVVSLHCATWPQNAFKWIERSRRYNFPSRGLIDHITNSGSELVPVGNPQSDPQRRNLEWRQSSSLADKVLIRALNIVQIQCYFLLKLVLSFLIKPHIRDVLSSYHMKVVLLHVVENTDPMLWTVDNLINCFMTCLQTFTQFLKAGYFPQSYTYIHNLLSPKMEGAMRRRICGLIEDLHAEGWKCVLRCAPFMPHIECGHRVPGCQCFILVATERTRAASASDMHTALCTMITFKNIILHCNTLPSLPETIDRLIKIEPGSEPYFPSQDAVGIFEKILSSHVGYMLLNITRSSVGVNNTTIWRVLKQGQDHLLKGAEVDMTSCRLKLATFYYQTGKLRQCIQVVHDVMKRYNVKDTLPVCGDDYREVVYATYSGRRTRLIKLQPLFDDFVQVLAHVAFPVTFSHWEIRCAPPAIQSLVGRRRLTTPNDRMLQTMVFVDGLVYAHYLLHMAYLDMGRTAAAERSLWNLRHVVEAPGKYMLLYPEVANQLLVYCETGSF